MKKLMVAVAVALLGAGAFADTYYVDADPTKGSDSYDGKAEVWDGEHGPWHTLAGAMTNKLNSGDIVIALPGWYDEGVSNPEVKDTGDPFIRVTVPNGVTLKSRDGAATTFIVGANSTAPDATAKGHGTNATRCVYLGGSKSRVEGFTICNGRTFSGTGSSGTNGRNTGGGVYGNASAVVVDCVISNCYAAYRGGAAYYAGVFHRCRFVKNDAGNGGSGNAVTMYNCYMADSQSYQCALYNCVCAKDGFPRGASAYNTILLTSGSSSNGSPKFYNCYYNVNLSSDCVTNGTCVKTTTAALALDADGRPQKGSIVINAANPAYVANIPAAFRDLDLGLGQRVYDGVADVGCYEYDPRGDYTDALCVQDGAMEVTAATPMVIGAENFVSIGTNQTLAVTLLKNGDAATTAWAFYATVEGTGTLELYFGDEATPSQTVTAADGKKRIDYSAADSTALRLVYAGEDGAAEVSQFCNRTEVTIEAASAGVSITGDITEAGTYAVPAGVTRTFRIARSNETTKFVSGIEVNGEFFNFYDYPNGKEFAIDGNDILSSVSIKVVYDDDVKELFVDRVNGSDSNCGLYTNLAFQSLAKAASIAKANWAILVQPGVYDNEVSNPEARDTATPLNRVTLPDDVTLKALGSAAETIVMGAKSDAPNATANGCGTNAVRCIKLGARCKVIGLTVSGGRTLAVDSEATGHGGGIHGTSSGNSVVIDCVVTNCCAYRGGGTKNMTAYRCLYINNLVEHTGPAAYQGTQCGCLFNNCDPYSSTTYNCTFLRGGYARAGTHYNALCLSDGGKYINGPVFHRCYFTYTPNTYSTPVLDADCVITNAAALPVDARGCPTAGSLAIDAGRTDYFEKIAAAYRDVDVFGGQRVYNGAVDVGCGEYDWRGDFAKTLAKKGVAVEVATANVTTNLEAGVDVPAGETLKLKLVLKTDGKVSFKAVAEDGAVVAVTVGGEPVTPGEGGQVEFEALAGETEVEIAVTGEGQATVSDVVLPKRGALLLIR